MLVRPQSSGGAHLISNVVQLRHQARGSCWAGHRDLKLSEQPRTQSRKLQVVRQGVRLREKSAPTKAMSKQRAVNSRTRSENVLVDGAKPVPIGEPDLVQVRPKVTVDDVPRLEAELPALHVDEGVVAQTLPGVTLNVLEPDERVRR